MNDWLAIIKMIVRANGAQATAKALGVSRNGLLAVLGGCSQQGTKLLVETRYREGRLADLAATTTPNHAA